MTEELAPGEVLLDRYRIEAPLASGAMGAVYVARQLTVDRLVAIKVLHPRRLWDDRSTERFRREADALARLQHPGIVHLFDFDLDPARAVPVLISELVHGRSLLAVLREDGPLPLARAIALVAQIAEALAYAHRAGIIHRDLKPANIMVTVDAGAAEERVKILDFGLAKLVDEEREGPKLTAPGAFVGTPGFASPEQTLGDPVDARTDLYSLGCLLYACLCARAPDAPALPEVDVEGTAIPAAIKGWYRVLLERNPRNRPGDAAAVAASLRAMLAPPAVPAAKRSRPLGAIAIAGAMIAVAMLMWSATRRPPDRPAIDRALPIAQPTPAVRAATVAGPAMRSILIETDPAGARAIVGDEPRGETPLAFTVREGDPPLSIALEKAGYRRQLVELDSASAEVVRVALKKIGGAGERRDAGAYPIW